MDTPSSTPRLEKSLKQLSRRELQSAAKHCGIRANAKSTTIVTEMLKYCRDKLKAAPLLGDLLFPEQPRYAPDDPLHPTPQRPSLVIYENSAFTKDATTPLESNAVSPPSLQGPHSSQAPADDASDQPMSVHKDDGNQFEKMKGHQEGGNVKGERRGMSEELAKAYREGKERGVWHGRMQQKLEDLEAQWKIYRATSRQRSKEERPRRVPAKPKKTKIKKPTPHSAHPSKTPPKFSVCIRTKQKTRSKINKDSKIKTKRAAVPRRVTPLPSKDDIHKDGSVP